MHTIFGLENLNGRDHLEDLGEDERYFNDLREIGWQSMKWIHLVQGRTSGRSL
jgi:hypothetical protein